MPIDKKPGESKDDFISRCIGIEINAGKEPDQAAAICYAKWEKMAEVGERGGIKESPKAPKSGTPNPDPKGEGTAKGDASSSRGAVVTERVEDILKKKADEFNERYKDKLGYGVDVGMLKTVYQRGVGAFNVSHSPRVQSAEQWALARVNAFLYIIKNGRPENPKYVNDNDLLPKDHPKKSGKKEEKKEDMAKGKTASVTDNTWSTEAPISINLESYDDYPEAAKRNAQVALDWAKENGWGDCGTPVGKVRANQLANGEAITRDTIARMAAFERHRQNSQRELGDGCGRLMWQAWGGDEGIEWAQRKLQEIDRQELKFKKARRVIFNEDFNEEVVREYKAMGYQVHIRSSRKIKKKDRKVWNKLKSVGLTEDALVFGEVKDLDKRYDYELLMTGEDPILEKLLIMGQPASKYRVIKSKPIHSTEEMVLASQEMLKDVDLRLAVVVKFQYEEIPGVPPAASGSRPFCSKILESNRLYSLDELKSLPTSHLTDLGLPADVITFRGGFYRNPDNGQTTPWCRHQWTAKVVTI